MVRATVCAKYTRPLLAPFSRVVLPPLFWPRERSNNPSQFCNGSNGPKGLIFQNKQTKLFKVGTTESGRPPRRVYFIPLIHTLNISLQVNMNCVALANYLRTYLAAPDLSSIGGGPDDISFRHAAICTDPATSFSSHKLAYLPLPVGESGVI